ncbi:MAG: glycoside hydrolase family 38 C-terminal domain-containing protein [Tepidisphaeraceae bacterium]
MKLYLTFAGVISLVIVSGLYAQPTAAPAATAPSAATENDTFWIIPHTHWEGAVFKTREEYLDIGLPHILKAVHLLKRYPDYRFVLDQVAYVKPFIERYPEEAAAFKQFVKEGRLQLVLGMDVMPDLNIPGGETLLRQIEYGKNYYRKEFGVDVTVGWFLDTFGHNGQMPQILGLAGYKSFWSQRGAQRPDHPAEFQWEGIDGTRIPTFLLPHTYAHFHGAPGEIAAFTGFAKQKWDMLGGPHVTGPNRVALSGADVTEPEEVLPPMMQQYNKKPDAPVKMRFGTPTEYEAAVAKHAELSVVKGELNPIFRGTFSSRIDLKQTLRLLEQRLTLTEKLACLSNYFGTPADTGMIERAWEPVFFNTAHDLASGVATNGVYADTVRSFEFSKRLVEETINTNFEAIASRIDTRGDGKAVVVFNPLGWPRTDLAEVMIGFADAGVPGLAVLDPAGKEVPVQITAVARYSDGGIKQANIAFMARDVPAVGYATYRIVSRAGGAAEPIAPGAGDSIENEHYKITCDPFTGAINSLLVKSANGEGNWEVFRAPANVVTRQEDKGDLWELYRGLDGAQKLLVNEKQPVPQAGQAKFSNEFKGTDPAKVKKGPVFSEFDVWHPFDDGTFAARIRVYAGSRRIDLRTKLVNQQRQVRYQALFPTTIKGGKNWEAIPLGAIERQEGVEYPAQEWVDYGDGQRGLALLNVGLPGNVVSDGTMMLSLLRAHNLGGYGFGGGLEPGMSSDTGFMIGREMNLHYALVPHAGDWRQAGVYRDGMEFNHPLVVRKAANHPGALPNRWGLLEISHPNAVLSALKPGRDGTMIVRVFEATGVATPGVKLKLNGLLSKAEEVNLMEDPLRDLPVANNGFMFDLKPFEIKTFKLQLRSLSDVK